MNDNTRAAVGVGNECHRYKSWKTAAIVGVAALTLLMGGCSKGTAPEQTKKPEAQANRAAESTATEASPPDEILGPLLKTPWKGDLDAMAKRRLVRVLVPFRRPEFFYMEGRPAGILHEAFQEVEKILNAKYKTTADNRIVLLWCCSQQR
jgi:hypothetical protein